MRIGRCGIAAAERLLLRLDHALCCGDVVGKRWRRPIECKRNKQDKNAHGVLPIGAGPAEAKATPAGKGAQITARGAGAASACGPGRAVFACVTTIREKGG